ncbi:uncharacterized protein LOC126574552 [Anopheles aquasalis]|uniref:uncharacterized protein LOC126574552 n=1 Tax=Anopheles aquasalis TaxID=42839 RepID=UPI00215A9AD2|nr:uncharacterized protein LOC126574552 [Anopheles aquasalis]
MPRCIHDNLRLRTAVGPRHSGDDPEAPLAQLVGTIEQRQTLQKKVAASDRASCDSGISLESDPATVVASPLAVRRRPAKPPPSGPAATGGGGGGGVCKASYVRRLTQLFENLSHEELHQRANEENFLAEESYHNQRQQQPAAMYASRAAPATGSPLVAAVVAELHQVIEEPGVPEEAEVVETVAAAAEVAQEAIEASVEVLREVKRGSRRSMATPRVASHRSTMMDDGEYYSYTDDEFDSTGDEEEDEHEQQQQGSVQGELAARADDFGESESSAPLLPDDSAAVPEARNPQLVSPEHRGKARYDEAEEDEFSSSSFDSDSDDEHFATSSGYLRPDSDSSLKTSRVKSILQELLQNEANYVQTLGRGIENYVSIMGSKELPPGLRGQRYHIFGNIEKIHSLHQDQFLPMLERNQASIQGIAETFIRFLERDKFYCYIMFALNRPKSERICNRNLDFFQRRQADVDDKLGLNSFLLQPIQRLPRYKLLLAEINKEILKQMEETLLEAVKGEIGILCKAEKRLERFIDIVNEAMSINDIQECYEINLFHQGKFRKMLEVDIYDWDQRRRYPAKMFLFERSAIYTEKCKTHLEYRGRYEYSEIGLYTENRNKVYLFARKRGIQEIEVHCSDMNEAQQLSNHVERMMTQFALKEKERLRNMGARVDLPGRIPSVITLQHHRRSDLSILSTASSIGSARESYESASQTTWSTDKPIAQLATLQKHFCQILSANRRHYFNQLPVELSSKIADFIRVYDRLLNVHVKRVYADLAKPDVDVDGVCELFIEYLKDGIFDDYNEYIRLFKPAAEVLKNIHKASRSSITDSMVAPTMDEFTFLCVQHWNKLQQFFQALVVQLAEQLNGGDMASQDLFRKLAYVEVQVANFRQRLFQNYRLFNLDEKLCPEMLGLVVYSDRVRYDNETISSHRVLLCDRSVVCVKFHFVREFGRQTEKYTAFAFIDRFGREGLEPNVKVSKKSEVRLNVLQGTAKHAIDFGNTANRDKFFGQYCTTFARFQERGL